jgi:hypothetical protein
MCGLTLLSEDGEVVDVGGGLNPSNTSYIGVGRLLKPDDNASIEIVRLEDGGYGNYEVVSESVVAVGSLEEVRVALQELGFTLLDAVCRKIAEYICLYLGSSKEKST